MLGIKDPGHIKRIKQVSYKLNIPEEVVEMALHYTSEYIKNKIAEVNIEPERELTKEEFDKKLPIINIPHIGYLKPNYYRYLHIREKVRLREELKNKENKNND